MCKDCVCLTCNEITPNCPDAGCFYCADSKNCRFKQSPNLLFNQKEWEEYHGIDKREK